jgi:hypothetical protein
MKIFFFRVKENISTVHGRKEILSFEEATITDLPDVGRHAKVLYSIGFLFQAMNQNVFITL